jgi:hypothetical protein
MNVLVPTAVPAGPICRYILRPGCSPGTGLGNIVPLSVK